MSYLDSFTEDQRRVIAALPYRVGLWVSESDDSGGRDADNAEMLALESILTGFAQDFCKSELVEEIMHDCLKKKDSWEQWGENMESLPTETRQAIEWLATHFNYKEVSSFKNTLMEIAKAVALAYCEFNNNTPISAKLRVYGALFLDRLVARIKNRPAKPKDEILNISHAERIALSKLSKALNLSEQEGLEPVYDYDMEPGPERFPSPPPGLPKLAETQQKNKNTQETPSSNNTPEQR